MLDDFSRWSILVDEEEALKKIPYSFVRKTPLIRNKRELSFLNKEYAWGENAMVNITLYREKLTTFSRWIGTSKGKDADSILTQQCTDALNPQLQSVVQ